MAVEHAAGGPLLALDVHAARRSLNLTTASLASASGVDEVIVRHVEEGDLVPPEAARAVCEVLDIPPVRHLSGLVAPRDVVATEPEQAAVVRVLRDLPDAGAHLVVSDVAAGDAVTGRTEATWADGQRRAKKARDFLDVEPVMIMASMAGIGSFAIFALMLCMSGGGTELIGRWSMLAPGILTFLAAVAGCLWLRKAFRYDADPETEHLLASWGAPDLRDLALHQGYVLSPAALSVVEVRDGAVTRTDLPLETMVEVTLVGHGTTHIDVTATTARGTTTLQWLPRTRDVVDVVQGWREAVASRSEPGVPYRLDVPAVPVLEGAL